MRLETKQIWLAAVQSLYQSNWPLRGRGACIRGEVCMAGGACVVGACVCQGEDMETRPLKRAVCILLHSCFITIHIRSCRKIMLSKHADTPGQTPPIRRQLQQTVRILLECILVFMQFSAKSLPNSRVLPQSQRLAPPSGKSWIRRWNSRWRKRNWPYLTVPLILMLYNGPVVVAEFYVEWCVRKVVPVLTHTLVRASPKP